ncbi:hypothetical protein [uncultured Aquimarina sp.]|uniref:hypothetical protein n=1 Tax=uncultured Aquimarina sp. TaxID=575652 RepID=UPI002632133D|nr:hypothetical protein [uncultured Aquimarina sp.]
MKKLNKKKITLSLDKIQIAKLNNYSSIKGGRMQLDDDDDSPTDGWPSENAMVC